jgi:hypothetical protein
LTPFFSENRIAMHNAKTLREIEVIDGAFAIRQDKKDPSNSCLGRLFVWDPRCVSPPHLAAMAAME